jgi:hypothetical protein
VSVEFAAGVVAEGEVLLACVVDPKDLVVIQCVGRFRRWPAPTAR